MKTTPKNGPWLLINSRLEASCISKYANPTRLHSTIGEAFTEAARLSEKYPGCAFAVFECIGLVEAEPKKPLEKPSGKCKADTVRAV